MTHRIAKTAAVLTLAALSTFAQSQEQLDNVGQMGLQTGAPDTPDAALETEPPGRVGRVSLIEGKVTISGDVGDAASDALLNWPVTTQNLITTAPGARAEVRVGSTAIRLDGDSSLSFTDLDDDKLHLRLHYGSASVHLTNADVAPEFELRTVQATVRLQQPGRVRIDAERAPDTSVVSVFDGEAIVDGAGASLTLRTGRSAEVRDEDVRTLQAQRDAFDDWSLGRDRANDGAAAARYVTTEMTGYEELDRHGSWSVDSEYGNLWTPAVVADWAPYRDGRWTWIGPWGWTWVDNAPWGYAPFHYGRWVQVNRRWAWAPGQRERRPVWSPALVGWVGGKDWNVGFAGHGGHRPQPATGWYPLGPRDRYVPRYRLSDERLRRVNAFNGRNDHRGRERDGRPDFRREGLTVVPNGQFSGRAPIVVPNVPRANGAGLSAPHAPGVAPPPPQGWRDRGQRHRVDMVRPVNERGTRDPVRRDPVVRDPIIRDPIIRDPILRDPIIRDTDRGERIDRTVRERNSWERDRDRIGREQSERGRFDPDRFNRDNRDHRERGQRQPLTTNPAPAIEPPRGVVVGPAPQPWQRPDRDANRERWRERHDGGGERGDNRPRPQPVAVAPPPRVAPAPESRPGGRPEGRRDGFPARGGRSDIQEQSR